MKQPATSPQLPGPPALPRVGTFLNAARMLPDPIKGLLGLYHKSVAPTHHSRPNPASAGRSYNKIIFPSTTNNQSLTADG
jgi:hypothetical protein